MLPLEYQIDAMSQVRSQLIMMRDSLETWDFKAIGGPMSEFGNFDNTEMLRHHHSLAHGLTLETLEAVIASVDVFYQSLVALQEELDSTDIYMADDAIRQFLALNNLEDSSYLPGTDEARDRYRDEHKGD